MAGLTRYRSPLRPMRRELDRLFGDFLTPFWEEEGDLPTAIWAPRMDLSETENEYVAQMDLPGVSKDDVSVDVEDHQIMVRGERATETKEEKKNYIRMERSSGSFYRAFSLPKGVKEDAIKADFNNGVLTIHLPKVEKSKPKTIKVS